MAGTDRSRDPASDEVADVHGRELEEQLKAARRLDEAFAALVAALPAPPAQGPGQSSFRL